MLVVDMTEVDIRWLSKAEKRAMSRGNGKKAKYAAEVQSAFC